MPGRFIAPAAVSTVIPHPENTDGTMQTSRTRITALAALLATVALVANLAGCASTAGIDASAQPTEPIGSTSQHATLYDDVIDASFI
jgi:hypothetical protein